MKKVNPKLLGFAWFIFVLIFVTGMFTVSFFLTAYLYKITNLNPPALLIQIVNSLLGLLFAGLMIGGVAKVARSSGWIPEMQLFGPIIEALEKIAQGDFSIRLDNEFQNHQIASELANTVNKMALELDQMEKMRQEFISNVSHEIQSPLTSIRGFAQALENDQLSPAERHHYLGIIENESIRLSRITEDLLKLASLESDQLKFDPRPYRLDKQIRNLILACEPQWTDKAIDMDVSLEEAEITADEDLLSQVWINLLHNSIKFTPERGKVCVALHQQDGRIEFRIADTGIGIAEEDQARVFERFFKADKSRERSKGGSGLGLSIAKTIVEMHKGTIEVESQLGAGTTFIVSLPMVVQSIRAGRIRSEGLWENSNDHH
jgi:two-component system, OmpR family, phosphate regulon sensor histidine kinase PhoR